MTTAGYAAQYAGVAAMGAGTGIAELVSRYKDDPSAALKSAPARLYIAVNAVASVAALGLILTFDWKFGVSGDAVIPTRLLVAGFGSMALFRSALFTVRIGKNDVGIGPSTFLSLILAACDRGVDRERARQRAQLASELMRNVPWEKAKEDLPAVAVALMQNLDAPDLAALQLEMATLEKNEHLSPHAKALGLAAALFTAVGPAVLSEAKDALGEQISEPEPEKEPPKTNDRQSDPETGDEELPPSTGIQERHPGRGLPATPQTPSDPSDGP
jgi:hypothetical protein